MTTDYIINSCGVCLNPDTLLEYHDKRISFKAKAMRLDNGKLATGFDITIGHGGLYSPVMPGHHHDDNTQAIIRRFRSILQDELQSESFGNIDDDGKRCHDSALCSAIRKAITWTDEQLCPNKQLEFDF